MPEEARPDDFRVICDLSGFKCWASETVIQWNGLRVLRRFADERNPQDFVAPVRESPGVPDARPEGPDVYADGLVQPEDL
jgi:hypothetical protein